MTRVIDIADYLEERIPSSLKEDYDNVGLLCGFPEKEVNRVLVVLDITLNAIREASEMEAELIISHHPVIFTPMRRVCDDTPDGKRVIRLLQQGISAICLHTNLDRAKGGVNHALASAIGADLEGELSLGVMCRLPETMNMEAFLAQTRDALNAPDMRFYSSGRPVSRIAVCGGAGGDIIYQAAANGSDTVLTGEIKHHQWIDGAELGLNLIEGGHFATENAVTVSLAEMLRQAFPEVDICLSCFQGQLSSGFEF